MNKIIILKSFLVTSLLIATAVILFAAPRNVVYKTAIGPAVSTSTVVLSIPGTTTRNCLTNVTTVANSTYTFMILSQGTTRYQALSAANVPLILPFGPSDPFCTAVNSSTTLKNDSGTFTINYQGYTY